MKPFLHKRLPAGALLYVISISLVIGLLISFFILFISYKKLYREQLVLSTNLLHNAESGINLLCADQSMGAGELQWMDLYETGRDSVKLKQLPWGVFDVLMADAVFKGRHEQLIALSGGGCNPDEQVSLYLADLDRPLSISGDTRLTGTAYLPKAGIRPAYIEGTSFTGDKAVYGATKNAAQQLPALSKDKLDKLLELSKGNFNLPGIEKGPLPDDSLKQSFSQNTVLISPGGTLKLNHLKLSGNIIVSARKIIVSADCQLKDVMLVAPYILIEEGFRGNAHFISSDTIIVEKKVELAYPSSLVALRERPFDSAPYISLDEDCKVNGVLLAWQKEYDIRYQPKLLLGKNAQLRGQLYSNGYAGLNASVVYGSVYAYKLLLSTGSSVYENHLLSTSIDGTLLPQAFQGLAFEDKTYLRGIAKWLY